VTKSKGPENASSAHADTRYSPQTLSPSSAFRSLSNRQNCHMIQNAFWASMLYHCHDQGRRPVKELAQVRSESRLRNEG